MQPPSNDAISAAFTLDIDWFDPTIVSVIRAAVCRALATLGATTTSGQSAAAPTPRWQAPELVGAAWIALMASRELVDPTAARQWRERMPS